MPRALCPVPAERPEVVVDFGDAPLGCVYEMTNNAPFPFQGVYPDTTGDDMVPLPRVMRFLVARDADASRAAAAGWEAAGGLGRSGGLSATARRAVVDAALALQALPMNAFPPHFWLPTSDMEDAVASLLPPGAPPPRGNHVAASAAFSAAMEKLSREAGACPQSADAADAVDVHHGDELCLRSLVLLEQQACPYTSGSNKLLFGPLAGQPSYGPEGLGACVKDPITHKCVNDKATFEKSDFGLPNGAACNGHGPTPARLLLGTADVKRDANTGNVLSITPQPAPQGFESPVTEWLPLRKDKLTGQLYRTEVWDLYNWTPGASRPHFVPFSVCVHRYVRGTECACTCADVHPMHFHLATLRVLGRYVVPIKPDTDENGYVDENEARARARVRRCDALSVRSVGVLC
jgi:hypothetical protein